MPEEKLIITEADSITALGFRVDDIQDLDYRQRSSGPGGATLQVLKIWLSGREIEFEGADAVTVYETIRDAYSEGGVDAGVIIDIAQIIANTAAIVSNDSDISANLAAILTNDSDISASVAAIGLNTTHRGSAGTDHANVVSNTSDNLVQDSSISANLAAIGLNTTHRGSDGSDHSDVVVNTSSVSANLAAILTNDSDISANSAAIAAVSAYTEGARAHHSANQTTTTAVMFYLAFDGENYDTDAIHHLTVNNGRLTCKTAGKYHIYAQCQFNVGAGGRRIWVIRLNGATRIGQVEIGSVADATAYPWPAVSTIYDLSVDDYVEIGVYQDSGGPLDILSNVGGGHFDTPIFGMQRVG